MANTLHDIVSSYKILNTFHNLDNRYEAISCIYHFKRPTFVRKPRRSIDYVTVHGTLLRTLRS